VRWKREETQANRSVPLVVHGLVNRATRLRLEEYSNLESATYEGAGRELLYGPIRLERYGFGHQRERIIGCSSRQSAKKTSRGSGKLATSYKFAESSGAAALPEHEPHARLSGPSVIKDLAGNGHGGDGSRWDDIKDDVGPDGGLGIGGDQSAAYADFAQFGVDDLGIVPHMHFNGDSYGNTGVLASWRRFSDAPEGLQNEIPLGGLFGRESNKGPGSHTQTGQSRAPGNNGSPYENLVRQILAYDFNHYRRVRR
jgi:hypothetical protein